MTQDKYIEEFMVDFCEKTDVTIEQLKSISRKRDIVEKRMIVAYFLRNKIGLTFNESGKYLNKNHASIIHYVKLTEDFINIYPHIKRLYDKADELYNEHKAFLSVSYGININKEKELKLVELLLEDNKDLKMKISKLEKEIYDYKKLNN